MFSARGRPLRPQARPGLLAQGQKALRLRKGRGSSPASACASGSRSCSCWSRPSPRSRPTRSCAPSSRRPSTGPADPLRGGRRAVREQDSSATTDPASASRSPSRMTRGLQWGIVKVEGRPQQAPGRQGPRAISPAWSDAVEDPEPQDEAGEDTDRSARGPDPATYAVPYRWVRGRARQGDRRHGDRLQRVLHRERRRATSTRRSRAYST